MSRISSFTAFYDQEKFEDTKGVIISCKLKEAQYNCRKKNDKRTNNDLQNCFTKHTHKTKYRVTRTPLKTGGEVRYSGKVSSFCSKRGTRRVTLATKSSS